MISPVGIASEGQARSGSAGRARLRSRVLARWHLLSLDAPSVAAVWIWFIARCTRVQLPWTAIAAMFCAVWVLYAGDRLLDARELTRGGEANGLEERHFFHFRHRGAFRCGIAAACVALAALLPAMTAHEVKLYLTLGAMLAGWFFVIHSGTKPLPKEFVVGIFFASAIFIPTVARAPWLRGELLAPAVLFGMLCSLNCLFIFAWEHDGSAHSDAHVSTRLAAGRAVWLGCWLAVASLAILPAMSTAPREILLAVALSAVLLVLLHGLHRHLDRTTLRALADLVLLTPLLLAGFAR